MKITAVVPNYNGAAMVRRCVAGLLSQRLDPIHTFSIVVVDDGSTDDSVDLLRGEFGDRIELVTLGRNCGRCTARNRGVSKAESDVIVFIDSDCTPADSSFVAAHAQALEAATDISFGEVLTPGTGFWDRLQRDGNRWRRDRFLAGDVWAFTTQNVAVRRELFDRIGGFDTAFERHGFEDRDLFLRLVAAGARAGHTPQAQVVHEDMVRLSSVSRKLGEAGEFAADKFAARHPTVYAAMPFGKLDCRGRRYLRLADALFWPIARHLTEPAETMLHLEWIPFRARALVARALYGLSFLHGTVVRESWKETKLPVK